MSEGDESGSAGGAGHIPCCHLPIFSLPICHCCCAVVVVVIIVIVVVNGWGAGAGASSPVDTSTVPLWPGKQKQNTCLIFKVLVD